MPEDIAAFITIRTAENGDVATLTQLARETYTTAFGPSMTASDLAADRVEARQRHGLRVQLQPRVLRDHEHRYRPKLAGYRDRRRLPLASRRAHPPRLVLHQCHHRLRRNVRHRRPGDECNAGGHRRRLGRWRHGVHPRRLPDRRQRLRLGRTTNPRPRHRVGTSLSNSEDQSSASTSSRATMSPSGLWRIRNRRPSADRS